MSAGDSLNPQQFRWWHGTPYGGPTDTPGLSGVHVGTQEAARQALNARIGHRADGRDWDGSSPYEKTLIAGRETLKKLGRYPTGYSARDRRAEDHYPDTSISEIPGDVTPALFPVQIVGPMSNTTSAPHEDSRANAMMKGQLKRGTAKRGYYYRNIGEDEGSVSAVVPGWSHLQRADRS